MAVLIAALDEIQLPRYRTLRTLKQNTAHKTIDDITVLNQWLRVHPDKKVISFSGVLAYCEDVSGYIVYFILGDNSKQKFERINQGNRRSHEPEFAVQGIQFLQEWKNTHPDAHIVAISTVPKYAGGVREFTICYEE